MFVPPIPPKALNPCGIGAQLSPTLQGGTMVVALVNGGPSQRQGQLQPGDQIVGIGQSFVDFVNVKGMRLDQVVELLVGEEGTTVHLQIIPANKMQPLTPDGQQIISIVRGVVKGLQSAAENTAAYDQAILNTKLLNGAGFVQTTNVTTTNGGNADALAALQTAFFAGHITAVVYEQAKAGLVASGGSTPIATPLYPQPQQQAMSRFDLVSMLQNSNNNSSTPYNKESNPLEQQMMDGILSIDNPLPCMAYPFMLPFPFLCMGCCLFGASKFEFDDKNRQASIKTWNGGCCGHFGLCSKSWVGNYDQIINFESESTAMTVNNQHMWTTKMTVKGNDGAQKVFKFGMHPYYTIQEKSNQWNAFIGARRG